PMPMMATRSLMPLLLIDVLLVSALGARLPEVIHYAVGGEHAAERHLHLVADLYLRGIAVGHLAEKAPAAVEVEDHADGRRVRREREPVERKSGDASLTVGERVGLHAILGAAAHADPL